VPQSKCVFCAPKKGQEGTTEQRVTKGGCGAENGQTCKLQRKRGTSGKRRVFRRDGKRGR